MTQEIFAQSFSARLEALNALEQQDLQALTNSAEEMLKLGAFYGAYFPGDHVKTFGEALHCLALQWKWATSVRAAESDSDRYRLAAKLRADEHMERISLREQNQFDELVSAIGALTDPTQIKPLEKRLAKLNLPFGVKVPRSGFGVSRRYQRDTPPPKPEIAFMKFEINGMAAKSLDTLAPNTAYDMTMNIRVSNWPETARRLIVEPVSLEPSNCYQMPRFEIERPIDFEGVASFDQHGKLVLNVAQVIGSKPFEFKYRAMFDPVPDGHYISLVGHRTLKLESVDPGGKALSGFENIDAKLYDIRKQLRTIPGLSEHDLRNSMTLLSGLGNVAGQAIKHDIFPDGMQEKEFQNELIKMLSSRPDIGSDLEVHPEVGGGISDLSFHQIRLELKADSGSEFTQERLAKHADQAAQYAVGSGKRIGILCALDSRKKTGLPVPADSLLAVQAKLSEGGGVAIVTIVIQGGLAKPSAHSR